MKTRNYPFFSRLILVLFMPLLCSNLIAQSLELQWKLESNGKIVAAPVENGDLAFIGNEKGSFMAIKMVTGELEWEIETKGNIQAKALLVNDLVFFESANVFYALKQDSGKEIWKYDQNAAPEKFTYAGKDYLFKLDPFDDKRSSGYFYEGRIYVGCSNGKVIGLNAKTGLLEFSIETNDNAPVRSSPKLQDGQLFFGDWNGVVYCYDLKEREFKWSKKTYRQKYYPTFGGIASEFSIYNGKLFFGARNHMMNVLWLEDGQKEWTYTDQNGGWIIGDPVIDKDTLYVGGSDNFSMLAFSPQDGRLLWKTKRSKNIYGKPIVTVDWVIYGGGNSYDPKDTGELVVLQRSNGEFIAGFETTSSVFSSPAYSKSGQIIFGSSDGTIYALKMEND